MNSFLLFSMTPPVCNLGEEIEDTRHFKFPTLPSPEYRENDPWLPFSTQTVSLTPSVMVSEGPISMETQCQSPDWGDTHTFPLFNFSGKTVGKGCSSVPYDKIVQLEKRMRCKTKKTNEGTTLLEELKKIQGKIEDNLKEASRLTDQIEKAVIGKKLHSQT
ncbi:uncharacterized protein [Mytilus edulis]|uniref:uncharacterized protein n=1 Tax=Mytilus edulis TaxID=6550 RepID=UPI0039F10222